MLLASKKLKLISISLEFSSVILPKNQLPVVFSFLAMVTKSPTSPFKTLVSDQSTPTSFINCKGAGLPHNALPNLQPFVQDYKLPHTMLIVEQVLYLPDYLFDIHQILY